MTIVDPPIKDNSDFYKNLSSRSKSPSVLTLFEDESDLVVIVAEEHTEDDHHSQNVKQSVENYSIKVCVRELC